MKPLNDLVFVKRDQEDEKIAGGMLFRPGTASSDSLTGQVLCVGPGLYTDQGVLIPMQVKAGDKVLFAPTSGLKLKVGDEELLAMHERDLLAIL